MARGITCTYGPFDLAVSGGYFTCVVTDISRPLLTDWILNTQEIPGRDGVRLLGQRRGPFDITVTFALWVNSGSDFPAAIYTIQSFLITSVTRRLVFGDNPSVYYNAIPQGVTDFEQLDKTTGRFTVTFHVPDGYMNEAARTADGAAGGTCTFDMIGNVDCLVKITVESASGKYTFADSNGNFCTVTCSSTPATLVIDGPNGTVTHGGTALMMDLSSDFLHAQPGRNTFYEQVGSSAYTIEYYPRW